MESQVAAAAVAAGAGVVDAAMLAVAGDQILIPMKKAHARPSLLMYAGPMENLAIGPRNAGP
jgi:hypothetical protein